MIDLLGHNKFSGARTRGRLVLVDLAGSERVSKSGVTGVRMKEAQAINKCALIPCRYTRSVRVLIVCVCLCVSAGHCRRWGMSSKPS